MVETAAAAAAATAALFCRHAAVAAPLSCSESAMLELKPDICVNSSARDASCLPYGRATILRSEREL